jgi:flap endonuclease-1
MGIKNLRKLLDKYAPTSFSNKKYADYSGKVIAIDASLKIYKDLTAMRKSGKDLTSKDGTVTSHLHGMLYLINKLLTNKIIPLIVFDGKPPELKKDTLKKRYDIRKLASDKLEADKLEPDKLLNLSMNEKISYLMQSTKISPEMIKDLKLMLKTLGVPYMNSPEEADAQMVCLLQNKLAYSSPLYSSDTTQ